MEAIELLPVLQDFVDDARHQLGIKRTVMAEFRHHTAANPFYIAYVSGKRKVFFLDSIVAHCRKWYPFDFLDVLRFTAYHEVAHIVQFDRPMPEPYWKLNNNKYVDFFVAITYDEFVNEYSVAKIVIDAGMSRIVDASWNFQIHVLDHFAKKSPRRLWTFFKDFYVYNLAYRRLGSNYAARYDCLREELVRTLKTTIPHGERVAALVDDMETTFDAIPFKKFKTVYHIAWDDHLTSKLAGIAARLARMKKEASNRLRRA